LTSKDGASRLWRPITVASDAGQLTAGSSSGRPSLLRCKAIRPQATIGLRRSAESDTPHALAGSTLEPPEVPVLPAPRPAVILIRTYRDERLAARAARPFGNGVAPAGGVQALPVALPVLSVGHHVAGAAPLAATVRRGSPDRKRLSVLDLSAPSAALLGHPAGVSRRGARPLRDLAVAGIPPGPAETLARTLIASRPSSIAAVASRAPLSHAQENLSSRCPKRLELQPRNNLHVQP
jgi:hypothetical protein